MDRNRLLLAFVRMMMVGIAPSIIWRPKKPDRRTVGQSDSLRVSDSSTSPRATAPPAPSDGPTVRPSDADTGRIVWVTSPLYRLGFSTRGGLLKAAELLQYRSFAPGDSARPVQLVPAGAAFLRHRLVLPRGDTVSLANWDFQPRPDAAGLAVHEVQAAPPLRLDHERRGSPVTPQDSFRPDT